MTLEEIRKLPADERLKLAFKDMARTVIEEHRRFGLPLIQWDDGKIVRVPVEEACRRFEAAERAENESKEKTLNQ